MMVQMGDNLEDIERGLARMGALDETAVKNLEMMKDAIIGILVHDYDRYFRVFSDDCIIHEPESLFYGGEHKGPAACLVLAKNVITHIYERCHFRVLEMGTGGDHVFIRYLNDFVFKGTGEVVQMHILEMWRIENGKVVECRPCIFDVHQLVVRTPQMDKALLTS